MALNKDHLSAFARLDTRKQVAALKRCGIDTEAADAVLGHLAGNHPERYGALRTALDRDADGLG